MKLTTIAATFLFLAVLIAKTAEVNNWDKILTIAVCSLLAPAAAGTFHILNKRIIKP